MGGGAQRGNHHGIDEAPPKQIPKFVVQNANIKQRRSRGHCEEEEEEVKYEQPPVTHRLTKMEELRVRQGGIHFFSEPQTIDKTLKADVTAERLAIIKEQFERMRGQIQESIDSGEAD